jgi:hypothetical protein
MSRDWKAAAAAFAPDIPAEQVEKISASLDGLEAAFRPLVARLPVETEPAYVLLMAREKDA